MTVSVQDKYGNPIPEITVRFKLVEGEGVLDADEKEKGFQEFKLTDEKGVASCDYFKLGQKEGVSVVKASIFGVYPERSVRFTQEALPLRISMNFIEADILDVLRFLAT